MSLELELVALRDTVTTLNKTVVELIKQLERGIPTERIEAEPAPRRTRRTKEQIAADTLNQTPCEINGPGNPVLKDLPGQQTLVEATTPGPTPAAETAPAPAPATTASASPSTAGAAPSASPAPAPATPASEDELKDALIAFVQKHSPALGQDGAKAKAKEILAIVGATKVSDTPADKRAEVIASLKAV